MLIAININLWYNYSCKLWVSHFLQKFSKKFLEKGMRLMKFNFKEALEEIKFLQTPKGKAEEFLRTTIDTIKTSLDVNRTESLCFEIYGEGDKQQPACYKLNAYYYHGIGHIPHSNLICFSPPFYKKEEVLLVYDIIKNKLKEDGFKTEETSLDFCGGEYYHLIKGFKIKI